jgi:hypothetical protein
MIVGLALIGAGCTGAPRGNGDSRGQSAPRFLVPLREEALGDLTYPSDLVPGGRIPLQRGDWQAKDGAARATLIGSALGDLNGDGGDDAAVLLLTDTGGTGRFVELVPVMVGTRGPIVGLATFIGDRVRPESLWIADRTVHFRVVAHGPDDGQCCPTVREEHSYLLEADSLVLERMKRLERLPAESE